jgi:hypothetical protein
LAIEPYPGAWTGDFPPHLAETDIENSGAREVFTWGPQTVWLLCGLVWIFCYDVRDIPELARNTAWIGAAMTALSAVGVGYELRRHQRRIVLFGYRGRMGCYAGGLFQYSFVAEEMRRVRPDFFGWMLIVLKGLLPMLLLSDALGVVMYDGWKNASHVRLQELWLFIYAMLCPLFGFVAILRSNFFLVFFWIPNGKGKTDRPVHLRPRDLQKIYQASSNHSPSPG